MRSSPRCRRAARRRGCPREDITGEDLSEVRFQLVLRGYKMSEVDWVMRRLGVELDELRTRVAELEQRERERESSPEGAQ